MKTLRFVLLLTLFFGSPSVFAVKNGDTKHQVLAELGNPDGVMNMGKAETLLYSGVGIMIKDGRVVNLPHNFDQTLAAAKKKSLLPKATPTPRPTHKKSASAGKGKPRGHTSGIRTVKNGGKKIVLSQYVTKGKITIVDFYADWCGPCRRIKPYLEQLAKSDSKVNLVQIDIVDWESEVTKQFKLRGIPHVRVYDSWGKLVGKPTSDPKQIAALVKKAK